MNEDFNIEDNGRNTLGMIVRGSGFFLLVIGLLVSLLTISEALKLYHEPGRIERFALAIENGSNIDKSLGSLRESAIADTNKDEAAPAPAAGQTVQEPAHKLDNVRVSYFLAWIIDLLLLLLIARIGLGAIKTGGELVLYDMQIKRFARMLIKESGKR
jgi:hypothetical protein